MDLLFLAYANRKENELPHLDEEDNEVYDLLKQGMLQQHYLIHRDSKATISTIHRNLIDYKKEVFLFSYSGHAGRDRLVLEDQQARSEGIIQALGQCPNLQVVILNGCSTEGQVKQLLEKGIPVVIATSAPVDDDKAKRFAIGFFRALRNQASISDAFNDGIAEIKSLSPTSIHRGMGRDLNNSTVAVWGIFFNEEKEKDENFLAKKLPCHSHIPIAEKHVPNIRLTNELWDILLPFSRRIKNLQQEADEDEEEIAIGDKHVQVLNSLPRPIAEHLRKLMCPVDDEQEGYDKISEARLQQITLSYQTTTEFILYILLAQLWESKINQEDLAFNGKLQQGIDEFLMMPFEEQKNYNFFPLILNIITVLQTKQLSCFVPELINLPEWFQSKEGFREAISFLNILRKGIQKNTIHPFEVPSLCNAAEEHLINFFRELGFFANYTLATVKSIDVLRYRHLKKSSFKHHYVRLMRVFGKLQEADLELGHSLFNHSVLLLKNDRKKDKSKVQELCLSPFLMDENVFIKNADLSKMYFFSHYQKGTDKYCYKYAHRPTDDLLEISNEKYNLIKEQFDAFIAIL